MHSLMTSARNEAASGLNANLSLCSASRISRATLVDIKLQKRTSNALSAVLRPVGSCGPIEGRPSESVPSKGLSCFAFVRLKRYGQFEPRCMVLFMVRPIRAKVRGLIACPGELGSITHC